MDNIINQETARKMTDEVLGIESEKEFKKIMKMIYECINRGEYVLNVKGCLKQTTKLKIENLGYKVNICTQYNERTTQINW